MRATALAAEPPDEPMPLAEMEKLSNDASALLRSLANPIRLRILCLLVEGELAVGVIAARLQLREALVSQHLSRLRLEGVVQARRTGTSVIYAVSSAPAMAVLQTLYDHFCAPVAGRATAGRVA